MSLSQNFVSHFRIRRSDFFYVQRYASPLHLLFPCSMLSYVMKFLFLLQYVVYASIVVCSFGLLASRV